MPLYDFSAAQTSNMSNTVKDYEVSPLQTDSATGQKETEFMIKKADLYWGYFNTHADLKSAIIMKAVWVVGKGYTAEPRVQVVLDRIRGNGKETFNDILFNIEICKRVYGNAFLEIITNDKGTFINLKVLDPRSMKVIVNEAGRIKRYEQVNKIANNKVTQKFRPEDILHITHNKLVDQPLGISDIESLEPTLKAEEESFNDVRTVMHRQARPFIIFKIKSDDTSKVDALIDKIDRGVNKGENIYVPDDENILSWEVVQINPSQVIMEWRTDVRNKFYRVLGLPLILFGNAGSTESGGKIEYLAHEQVFARDQKSLELQFYNQTALLFKLVPPVTLLENLQRDEGKDAQNALTFQQNDVTAGAGA